GLHGSSNPPGHASSGTSMAGAKVSARAAYAEASRSERSAVTLRSATGAPSASMRHDVACCPWLHARTRTGPRRRSTRARCSAPSRASDRLLPEVGTRVADLHHAPSPRLRLGAGMDLVVTAGVDRLDLELHRRVRLDGAQVLERVTAGLVFVGRGHHGAGGVALGVVGPVRGRFSGLGSRR